MTHKHLALLACCAVAGCGSTTTPHRPAAKPQATLDPLPAATPVPGTTTAELRAAVPKQDWFPILMKPALHLRLPDHWTGNDLYEKAFSVFPGGDEVKAPGELTIGSELAKLTPRAAIARMRATGRGIRPTPTRAYDLGSFTAYGFETPPVGGKLRFPATGFHVDDPRNYLRLMAFSRRGRTYLATIIVNRRADFSPFSRAAMRVMRTVR